MLFIVVVGEPFGVVSFRFVSVGVVVEVESNITILVVNAFCQVVVKRSVLFVAEVK